MKRLFARFSVVYGHVWQSLYKQKNQIELADKEWSETLEEITDETLEFSLQECKKRYDLPPTLPMFYQLCRSFQPKKYCNTLSAIEEKMHAEKAEKYLKELTEALCREK